MQERDLRSHTLEALCGRSRLQVWVMFAVADIKRFVSSWVTNPPVVTRRYTINERIDEMRETVMECARQSMMDIMDPDTDCALYDDIQDQFELLIQENVGDLYL